MKADSPRGLWEISEQGRARPGVRGTMTPDLNTTLATKGKPVQTAELCKALIWAYSEDEVVDF